MEIENYEQKRGPVIISKFLVRLSRNERRHKFPKPGAQDTVLPALQTLQWREDVTNSLMPIYLNILIKRTT